MYLADPFFGNFWPGWKKGARKWEEEVMKPNFVILGILIAFSGIAHADQLCGVLGSHRVAPECKPREACPNYYRVVYDISNFWRSVDVEVSDHDVYEQLGYFEGKKVCVEGKYEDGNFLIESIRAK